VDFQGVENREETQSGEEKKNTPEGLLLKNSKSGWWNFTIRETPCRNCKGI
jgi:hypothetical protein